MWRRQCALTTTALLRCACGDRSVLRPRIQGAPVRAVRQHANPLQDKFYTPPVSPWSTLARPALPWHLDLGCARGEYLVTLAQRFPDMNFVGVDVRREVVDAANRRARAHGVAHQCVFLCTNFEFTFPHMLPAPGPLVACTILHPDPHFKNRTHKRRILTPQLVCVLAWGMRRRGVGEDEAELLVQTDVHELHVWMCAQVAACEWFEERDVSTRAHLASHVASPREAYVRAQGGDVYTTRWARNARNAPVPRLPQAPTRTNTSAPLSSASV